MRVSSLIILILIMVEYSLEAPLDISISGNPGTLSITTATAGQQPTAATNSSTTYSVTTLVAISSIIGKIDTTMPANTTLRVTLAAPPGATSAGAVSMTTTNKNLVTNIPSLTIQGNLAITYNLSATVNAAQTASSTRTLTLTVQ